MFANKIFSARTKKKSILVWLFVGVCFLFAATQVFHLILFYNAPTYVQDQWGLMYPLLTGENLMQTFFTQHGSHFLGLGGACSYLLVSIFGFVPLTESYLIFFITMLSAALFIWLKIRLTGSVQLTDGIIPLVVLNLNQYEIFTWVAHGSVAAIPLLLCVIAALLLTLKPSSKKYALLTLVQFFSLFTGYAFILGFILFFGLLVSLVLRKPLFKTRITHAFLQLIGICLFFYLYAYPAQNADAAYAAVSIGHYLHYLSEMLLNFFGHLENRKRDWLILLLVFFTPLFFIGKSLLKRSLSKEQKASLVVLVSFTMVYVALNTLARVPIGQTGARAPRYVTFLIPAFLSFYFLLAIFSQKRIIKWRLLLLLPCVGYAITTLLDTNRIRTTVAITNTKINTWNKCYVQKQNAELCADTELFKVLPNKPEKYMAAINAYYLKKL